MSDVFLVIRGKLDWAKLTGAARPYKGNPKYDHGPSWSVDVTPDAKSLKLLRQHVADLEDGRYPKLKDPTKREKDDRKEKFISLKVLKYRKDGTENQPPKIETASGKPWDGGLIGNGTVADVKVKVVDYDGTVGVYLQAVRILKHVPYEGATAFEPLSEDDEFFGDTSEFDDDGDEVEEKAGFDTDLDDDVPF